MGSLSVGERQIVEIARALAMGSEIVILDEPTSSLSFKEKETLFKVVGSLKREGKAIIYITHTRRFSSEGASSFATSLSCCGNGQLHMARRRTIKDVTKDDIVQIDHRPGCHGRERPPRREVKGRCCAQGGKNPVSPVLTKTCRSSCCRGEFSGYGA